MPPRAHRLLIPLAAFLAILPILIAGPSCGHDFDFHVLSWFEAASQFTHLHYPHWAYTPAFNAGEPRFLFYPPISWALGAILGLILPWTLVPAAFTFIALTLSGLTMRRLAARYASPNAATLAAVLYLANPYMLFTAYERTAYGELLAAAWLPLLFLAAFSTRVRIAPLAIPIALLWLTNAPAAVMSSYALAFLILIRLTQRARHPDPDQREGEGPLYSYSSTYPESIGAALEYKGRHPERSEGPLYSYSSTGHESTVQTPEDSAATNRLRLAATTIAATILGLTLSAFYLVPAIHQRPNIQSEMATITGMRIADNTLFHHMLPATQDNVAHDVVLHTASLITVLILLAIAAAFLIRRKSPRPSPVLPLTLLTVLIAILLTPISLPIWTHTPELHFLQFPWRLTALLGAILALFAALAVDRIPRLHTLRPIRATLIPILLAILLITPAWLLFHQPCDDEDTVPARLTLFHSPLGTDPTDEYTPATADNDALAHSDPPYWLAAEGSCDAPAPSTTVPGQSPTHLTLNLPTPETLILNRRAFPTWQLRVNGALTPSCARNDGLIAASLPAGHDTISLTEHPTPDQPIGLALALLSALILAGMVRRPSF